MERTVLVTGGSGFIGTWVLRELLAHEAKPVVVDVQPATARWERILGREGKERVTWADASLLDRDRLQTVIEQHGVTHVIHLAALLTPACQQDPWLGCQVNVLGSTAVFDAARRASCVKSISYASSYAVYGPESGAADGPNRPPMFYGAFKQAVDLIAEQYWRHFELPSVAVRPHVVYGPERDQGLTAGPSLACRAAALGEHFTIGYTGRVGYDYVEDVAQALVRSALAAPHGATVVDLPGEQATTDEFAATIEAAAPESRGRIQVAGPPIPTNIPPQPNYIVNLFPHWQATSLAEGVRRTVAFYRQGSAT